jgi:chromosome segregation ATPase
MNDSAINELLEAIKEIDQLKADILSCNATIGTLQERIVELEVAQNAALERKIAEIAGLRRQIVDYQLAVEFSLPPDDVSDGV